FLFVFFLLVGDLGQTRDEVAERANLLLGFFLAAGRDGVFHLAAGGVHCLVLIGRHGHSPEDSAACGFALATFIHHRISRALSRKRPAHHSSSVTVSRTISSIVVAPV